MVRKGLKLEAMKLRLYDSMPLLKFKTRALYSPRKGSRIQIPAYLSASKFTLGCLLAWR